LEFNKTTIVQIKDICHSKKFQTKVEAIETKS